MVFFVAITLSFIISTIWSGGGRKNHSSFLDAKEQGNIQILLNKEGDITISMEEYICMSLCVAIPIEYELECLKAQAVLLRTNIIYEYKEQTEDKISDPIFINDAYGSKSQLEGLWGTDYMENYEKVKKAVEETRGIYMIYQGEPIFASYFRVSGGQTRDGSELLSLPCPYLKSVDCKKDYLSEDYLSKYTIKEKELETLLGGKIVEIVRDQAGYCLFLVMEDGTEYPGEWFREQLNLNSAHITFQKQEKEYVLIVKGLGHGLGMSQYGANEMALEGKTYDEILTHFFQNIRFDKYD
ncbi:hypothetical protein LJC58_02265 [Lachnospiraceae bacterium OttesenSCG-928-D06]|nr:hypothetical protein [Lachnospiraceae bacterium OttesenSCG-928-D06]